MMNLGVFIDERARELIHQRGNLITISQVSINNCCVPIDEVDVKFSKPEYPEKFNKIHLSDILLYVDKTLDFKNKKMYIHPTGFGPFRSVRIEGVSHF